jgi:hypothetical protein
MVFGPEVELGAAGAEPPRAGCISATDPGGFQPSPARAVQFLAERTAADLVARLGRIASRPYPCNT